MANSIDESAFGMSRLILRWSEDALREAFDASEVHKVRGMVLHSWARLTDLGLRRFQPRGNPEAVGLSEFWILCGPAHERSEHLDIRLMSAIQLDATDHSGCPSETCNWAIPGIGIWYGHACARAV